MSAALAAQLARRDWPRRKPGTLGPASEDGASPLDAAALYPRWADFLVVITPGGAATRGMIDAEVLKALGPQGYLVNVARGTVVDQPALIEALKSGHLGGAALDTFVVEPPEENNELLRLPNVTLTPHIAGASRRVATYSTEVLVKDLRRFIEGKPLANRCK